MQAEGKTEEPEGRIPLPPGLADHPSGFLASLSQWGDMPSALNKKTEKKRH